MSSMSERNRFVWDDGDIQILDEPTTPVEPESVEDDAEPEE